MYIRRHSKKYKGNSPIIPALPLDSQVATVSSESPIDANDTLLDEICREERIKTLDEIDYEYQQNRLYSSENPTAKPIVKRKIKRKKAALIAAAVIAAVITVTTITYAWLQQTVFRDHQIVTTSIQADPRVYFLQNDGITEIEAQRDSNGYYIADLSNASSPTYAGKLKIDIEFKGVTHSYIRVFVTEMLFEKEYTPSGLKESVFFREDLEFKTTSDWLDNRLYDTFYYYQASSGDGRGIIFNDDEAITKPVPFIEGIKDISVIENGEMRIEICVDTVQFNRINAFWNMSNIPTE